MDLVMSSCWRQAVACEHIVEASERVTIALSILLPKHFSSEDNPPLSITKKGDASCPTLRELKNPQS